MTDLEISKELALAIGWEQILNSRVCKDCWVWTGSNWHIFDYRDWNVIGPIAAKYKRFPTWNPLCRDWFVRLGEVVPGGTPVHADTPQKAIALAVIGAKK